MPGPVATREIMTRLTCLLVDVHADSVPMTDSHENTKTRKPSVGSWFRDFVAEKRRWDWA